MTREETPLSWLNLDISQKDGSRRQADAQSLLRYLSQGQSLISPRGCAGRSSASFSASLCDHVFFGIRCAARNARKWEFL